MAAFASGAFFGLVILCVPLTKLTSSPEDSGSGMTLKKCNIFMSKYEMPLAPETDLDAVEESLSKAMGRKSSATTLGIGVSMGKLQSVAEEHEEERMLFAASRVTLSRRISEDLNYRRSSVASTRETEEEAE